MAPEGVHVRRNKYLNLTPLHLGIGFFFLILGVLLKDHFVPLVIISILYAIDIIFSIFLRFTVRPIYQTFPAGIEMVTMNTILAGYLLGPVIGVFCGLLFSITYYGIVFDFGSIFQVVNIPMYAVIGYLAGAMTFSNFLVGGLFLAIIYSFSTSVLSLFLGGRISKASIFFVTNVIFNYWAFTHIAPLVLQIV